MWWLLDSNFREEDVLEIELHLIKQVGIIMIIKIGWLYGVQRRRHFRGRINENKSRFSPFDIFKCFDFSLFYFETRAEARRLVRRGRLKARRQLFGLLFPNENKILSIPGITICAVHVVEDERVADPVNKNVSGSHNGISIIIIIIVTARGQSTRACAPHAQCRRDKCKIDKILFNLSSR